MEKHHPAVSQDELCDLLSLRASWLSYAGFAWLIRTLLRQMGYQNVEIVSRRSFKGMRKEGGIDLRATVGAGLDQATVIVQLKPYRARRNIARFAVDGLRGVLVRERAAFGMIVGTAPFSKEAWAAARACPDVPIALIDGEELGNLLVMHGMGVVEQQHPVTGRVKLVFDEEYFDFLDRWVRLNWHRLVSLTEAA